MKSKTTLRHFLALAGSSLLAVSSASAQSTYTWSNANVTPTTTPSTLNWINATQATWTGGTPVSNNLNTIQFFDNNSTALTNNAAATQASVLDNGSAFQLGTLTLSGLGSSSGSPATLTMDLSGDALNFSAATGRINLDALNGIRPIIYNVANNIQLGTASSGSVLTLAGNGTSTFNLNGVISELQTGGGSLVKTGTTTVSLTGANTFTGSTTINGGNVTLSGASGSLASTDINLISGGLTLNNSSTTGNSGNRISNSATITVTGNSALTFSHNGASGIDYSETIGTLSLQSGFLTYTGSQAHATGPRSSNLLFNTLSRSGTATANFAGTGLGTNVRNTIKFGSGVTANADLGPWAVVNGTDFAYYDATNGIVATTSSTLATNSSSATTNFNTNGASITFDASLTPSLKTLLINSTAARTVSLNGNTVSVGGISAASSTNNIFHTISGTGALQALNAGDALYVNFSSTNSGSRLQIDSNIQNYNGGTTGSALVKYGAGTVTVSGAVNISGGLVVNAGTLNLTNADNSITGGFTLNGGSLLSISTATHDNNNITVNGSSVLGMVNTATTNGTITLNAGSILSLATNNGGATFTGAVTGAGSIDINQLGLGGNTISLNSTGNTFTGNILFTGPYARTLNINSLTDTTTLGAGNIRFSGPTATFALGSGAVAPLTLNNRQFEFLAGTFTISNDSSQTFTVNSDLLIGVSGVSTSLGLGGTGSGLSYFNSKIENGSLTSLGLTKSGSGTWVLGNNANTYTGVTTISAGTLQVSKLADGGATAGSSIGKSSNAASNLVFNHGGRLLYVGSGDSTDRLFTFNGTSNDRGFTIESSGTGALSFTSTGAITFAGTSNQRRFLNLSGSNTDDNTFAGQIVDNGIGTTNQTSVTKLGLGKWVLTGTSNNYTGTTTVNGGILELKDTGTGRTQSYTGLTFGLGDGTLTSNRAGSGTFSTTFTTLTRSAGATGNFVSTGGANGSTNIINTTGAAGYMGKGLFYNNSEIAWREGTNGYARAIDYGVDSGTSAVGVVATGTHMKFTSSVTRSAGLELASLHLAGDGVNWTNSTGLSNINGSLIKSGGGTSLISGAGTVGVNSNQELVVHTVASNDTLEISSIMPTFTAGLTKSGAGTLILSNAGNTFNSEIFINAGTLSVGAFTNLGVATSGKGINLRGGTLQATGTFGLFNGTPGTNNRAVTLANQSGIEVTGTNTLTIAGVISNNTTAGILDPGFNKTGTGTLALSGTNTYTGITNVNAGKLLVNNTTGSGTGTGTVNVGALGTLGGSGTIRGAVNVTGTISAGNSIETLATGTLSMANSSTLVHELDSSVATSVASDLLKVTGDLNFTGTVNLSLTDLAATDTAFAVNDIFSLINYTGAWNNGLLTFEDVALADEDIFTFGLNTWKISYNDATGGLNYTGEYAGTTDSFVNLTAVTIIPEPRAALLGGLGMLMLLRRRRR